MPQVRGTLERFVSRVIPDVRRVVRTRPLESLVIGAYVRGLSDRDIESLLDEAGLGHVSKNAASQVCRELRARYAAFCAKSLAEGCDRRLYEGGLPVSGPGRVRWANQRRDPPQLTAAAGRGKAT